jgi:hypothetical protein
MNMHRVSGLVLAILAGSVIGVWDARAEEAPTPKHKPSNIAPNAAGAALPDPARAFDPPAPAYRFDLATPVTITGLGPGEDLRGTEEPVVARLSPAELDLYTNSIDYKQLASHYFPRSPLAPGTQFLDLSKAVGGALVNLGAESVKDSFDERLHTQVEAGKLAPIDAAGVDAGFRAAEIALAAAPVILSTGEGGLRRKGGAVGETVLGGLLIAGVATMLGAEN